jgi:hypothetical protein
MQNVPGGSPRLARWARVGVGTGLLIALFAVVDVRSVYGALHAADAGWMLLALGASLAARLLAAERNYSIVHALTMPLRRSQVIVALFVSNFWSLILPGVSAGSIATVYQFRRHGAQGHSSLGALGASRFVELLAFAVLGTAGLVFDIGHRQGDLRRSFLLAAVLVIGMTAGGVLALRHLPLPDESRRRSLAQRAWHFVLNVGATLRRLGTADYVRGSLTALVQAVFDALILYCIARAVGVELSLIACFWVNGLSYFTLLLPISIAGLGVREAAILAALAPLGVPGGAALAIALLMLAVTLINALIGAGIQIRNAAMKSAEART